MQNKIRLLPALVKTMNKLPVEAIAEERRLILQPLIEYIQLRVDERKVVNLNFICTHNSRRSQFAQIWASVSAAHFGIPAHCFSGGVEVTEFNQRAVESLRRAGFVITQSGFDNPVYSVSFANGKAPVRAYSKMYSNPKNTNTDFAAIMTCDHADQKCPLISGADIRIPITYHDPKVYDNRPEEAAKYDERSRQVAAEMYYVFSKIVGG